MAEPSTPGARPSQRASASQPGSAPKPLLASEALREEVAPVEPARQAARVWCVVGGAVLGGLLLLPPGAPPGSAHQLAIAIALVVAGVLPLPYGARALILLASAGGLGALGVSGRGPLGAAAVAHGPWGMLPLLATVTLGGCLLFRARYRAYARARAIMFTGLLMALPFAAYCVLALSEGALAVQVTAGIALGVVALSTAGFSASAAMLTGGYLTAALIVSASAFVGAQLMAPLGWPPASAGQLMAALWASVALGVGSTLGAMGVYQLLAWRHWRSARKVDVRKVPASRPPEPSLSDTWSTRP